MPIPIDLYNSYRPSQQRGGGESSLPVGCTSLDDQLISISFCERVPSLATSSTGGAITRWKVDCQLG